MNITKEMLDHLHVRSLSLRYADTDLLCFLVRQETLTWTLFIPSPVDFQGGDNVSVRIQFSDGHRAVLSSPVIEYGVDWCTIQIPVAFSDTRLSDFLVALRTLEADFEHFGRRKEARIKIGKERAAQFGLASAEQTLFLPHNRFQQPCAIIDASIHGICIITPFSSPELKTADNLSLKIFFSDPEQHIVLNLHKVHVALVKADEKTFARISCQLLEPIHFAWKQRIIRLMEQTAAMKT